MIHVAPDFQIASIATEQAIFAAELTSGFETWIKIPSDITQNCIQAWLKMGARARLAHDQQLASYYRESNRGSYLPANLQSIQSYAEFEEWRTIALEIKMAGFSYFVREEIPSCIKVDGIGGRRVVDESLRKKGLGFETDIKPLFLTKSGNAVYLQVRQRRHLVDAHMLCCPLGMPAVLANHCGLHGIVTECKADVLTALPDIAEIVSNEIVRHVTMMREKAAR